METTFIFIKAIKEITKKKKERNRKSLSVTWLDRGIWLENLKGKVEVREFSQLLYI